MWCVIEGIDGSGKSALTAALAKDPRLTVVLKDDPGPPTEMVDERLAAMHRLAWSYDNAEAVWTYPRRYWLHTLAAWFWLFHHHRLADLVAEPGAVVVTDGWYFKHLARFQASGDDGFAAAAAEVFGELPQPDVVVLVDTPPRVAQERLGGAVKPSEAGAFGDPDAAHDLSGFVDYQARTRAALGEILDRHSALVLIYEAPAPGEVAERLAALVAGT
jgi:thymidylate kinase